MFPSALCCSGQDQSWRAEVDYFHIILLGLNTLLVLVSDIKVLSGFQKLHKRAWTPSKFWMAADPFSLHNSDW